MRPADPAPGSSRRPPQRARATTARGEDRAPGGYRTWLVRVIAVSVLSAAAVNGVRPMVSYRALALGAGPFELGLVASSFSIFSMLLAMPIGRWVDQFGERRFIIAGALLVALGAAAAIVADSLAVLAAGQAVMGCGQILILVAAQALVANNGSSRQREERYGWYSTGASLGQLVGPATAAAIVGGAVASATTSTSGASGQALDIVFALGAVAGVVAALVALTLPDSGRRLEREPSSGRLATLRAARRVVSRPGMRGAMFVSISIVSSIDALVAYLPLYGESVGLPIEFVSTLLALRAAASLVSRVFMRQAIALLGRSMLLVVTMTVAGIALVAVTLTAEPVFLVVLLLTVGLGLGLGQPMTMAWVANRSPRLERGTALGVRLTGHRAALFIVPSILGTVAGATGASAVFWVLAALLGSGAGVASRSPFDEPAEVQPAAVAG